jgi:hypothetical protein
MRRKQQVVDNTEDDGWVWGNHRGGGGAPLKDYDGNNVTNLKKVLKGEVEIENASPNSNPKRNKNNRVDWDENNENHSPYNSKHRRDSNGNNKNNTRYEERDDSQSPRKGMNGLREIEGNYNAREKDSKAK